MKVSGSVAISDYHMAFILTQTCVLKIETV